MQQLLRQLHIAVVHLADAAAGGFGFPLFAVNRFDDLHEVGGAVGPDDAAVMLRKLLQTAGMEWLHADGRNECDQLLGLLAAHYRAHKDLWLLHGAVDRAALEQGAQDIVLGPARHAGQIGGGVIHDLADAGIAIHDLCSFCKHCGALPYCFCLYYSTFFGRM